MNTYRQVAGYKITHERLSRLLIGCAILAGLGIGYLLTPWGYLILVGTAVNLIQFAFTGKCKVKDMLDGFGVPYEEPAGPSGVVIPFRRRSGQVSSRAINGIGLPERGRQ